MENTLIAEGSEGYELIDCGDGEKLERFGNVVVARPDPQALWPKYDTEKWKTAQAVFTRTGTAGKWHIKEPLPDPWQVTLSGLTFSLKLLPSKHVGVFPEQSMQWNWLEEKIASRISPEQSEGNKSYKASATTERFKVLNLFGYTGGASLACAKAGAEVCHVDSSEWAVTQAKENAGLSGLGDMPIRYIVDDVRKFVEREVKRGNKYDIILLDPPVYGKGDKKQVWKIEEDLQPLLARIKSILSENPVAVVVNGYASVYSHGTYAQMLSAVVSDLGGNVSSGELAIKDSFGKTLPAGIFARWEK